MLYSRRTMVFASETRIVSALSWPPRFFKVFRSKDYIPIMPVMTAPMWSVSRNRCVTEEGSSSRSGTLRCAATTAASVPRRATDVRPPWFMAFSAYSAIPTTVGESIRFKHRKTRAVQGIKSPALLDHNPRRIVSVRIFMKLTDLIQPTLGRKDCDMPVEPSTTFASHFQVDLRKRNNKIARKRIFGRQWNNNFLTAALFFFNFLLSSLTQITNLTIGRPSDLSVRLQSSSANHQSSHPYNLCKCCHFQCSLLARLLHSVVSWHFSKRQGGCVFWIYLFRFIFVSL